MKRLSMLLLLVALWATSQAWAASGKITTNGTDCSVATRCLVVSLPQDKGGATLTLSGTWTGTIQFEASGDGGASWASVNVMPLNATIAVTSSTSNGVWQVNMAGFTNIRMRSSASMTGTAMATITPSAASARSGGGGAVASVTGAGSVSCSPTTGAVVCTGSGGATPPLDSITDPVASKSFDMGANTLNFNFTGNWGSGYGYSIVSNGSNASTGPLLQLSTGTSTAMDVFQACAQGTTNCLKVDSTGLTSTNGAVSAALGFSSAADGTHPGILKFAGNTTLPTLTANTVSIIGFPAATNTAWSLQLPTAIPTTNALLKTVVTSTNALLANSDFTNFTSNAMGNTTTTSDSTWVGGQDASANSALGKARVRGADQTGTGGASSQGGGAVVRGGNNAATNAASQAGSVEITPGKSTGSTQGLQGLLTFNNVFVKGGGTSTQWNLQCFTAAMTVNDCAASPTSIAGVADSVGTNTVETHILGSETPINASAAVTAGHTVCAGTSAGQVTDSGGTAPCTTGFTVGIAIAVAGSWTLGDGATFTATTTLPLVQMVRTQSVGNISGGIITNSSITPQNIDCHAACSPTAAALSNAIVSNMSTAGTGQANSAVAITGPTAANGMNFILILGAAEGASATWTYTSNAANIYLDGGTAVTNIIFGNNAPIGTSVSCFSFPITGPAAALKCTTLAGTVTTS